MMKLRYGLVLLSLFAASPAFAASKMYISEYNQIGEEQSNGARIYDGQMASEPAITDQSPVDFSGGVASSAAFGSTTSFVRVLCTATCSVKVGTNPTATTSNKPIAAGLPEYFAVKPGQGYKISVIANSDF